MRLLLTGGSGCGKSTYAETLIEKLPLPRYYVAAMMPTDDECLVKIDKHRDMRSGRQFETIERYTDIAGLTLPRRGTVLLECLCNLVANEMFDEKGDNEHPFEAVLAGIENLSAQSDHLIVITNDVGSDGNGYDPAVEEYVRTLGRVNNEVARRFEHVQEMVCGMPIPVKGGAL